MHNMSMTQALSVWMELEDALHGENGYEGATAEIRRSKSATDLPIIALTAKAMKEDRAKCIAAGANDYLAKPVDSAKLLSVLRVWLYS